MQQNRWFILKFITATLICIAIANSSLSKNLKHPIHIYTWPKTPGASFYEGVIWTQHGPQTFITKANHISTTLPAKVYIKAFTTSKIPFVTVPVVIHTMSFRAADKSHFIKIDIPKTIDPMPNRHASEQKIKKELHKKNQRDEEEKRLEEQAERKKITQLEKEQETAFDHDPFRFLRIQTGVGTKKLNISGDEIEFSGKNGYFSVGIEFLSKLSEKHFFRTTHHIHNFSIKKKNENSEATTTETIQNRDHSFELLSHWYFDFTLGMEISTYPSLAVSHTQSGNLDLQENYRSTYLFGIEWAQEISKKLNFRLLGHHSRNTSAQFTHSTIKFKSYYSISPSIQIHSSLENHNKKSFFRLNCPNEAELSICNKETNSQAQFSEIALGIGFYF